MTKDIKLLAICGSLRKASTNLQLMREGIRLFGPAEVTEANLRLPLYDGDLEAEGMPEDVTLLARQIAQADAVLVVTPEYNKNLSGVLKNALDWVSRIKDNPWLDKPVAIMSAAAGRAGGERSQFSARHCLSPFQPRLITGPEVFIAASGDAFDANGRLINERSVKGVTNLMAVLRREAERG